MWDTSQDTGSPPTKQIKGNKQMIAKNKMTEPHMEHSVTICRAKPGAPHYAYYYCNDCQKFVTWIDRATYTKEAREQQDNSIMWFGQYQGLPIAELPQNYLEWCINNISKTQRGYELLEQEYLQRQQQAQ